MAKIIGNQEFLNLCKNKVVEYFNQRADKTDCKSISIDDTFVVWYAKNASKS